MSVPLDTPFGSSSLSLTNTWTAAAKWSGASVFRLVSY